MFNYTQQGFREERFFQFPNIINLEVFRGQCPCSCIHCPVGIVKPSDRLSQFGLNHVSKSILHKVTMEMKSFPHSTLRLHSVGDPILWDGLVCALEYIHEEGIKDWIFTSLVTEDSALLEALAQHCSIIEVSMNSIDADDYTKTKGIDAFDLVSHNIKELSQYINSNHLSTRLVVSRVQSLSVELDNAFVAVWKDTGLVDDAFVRKYHNYNNILDAGLNGFCKPSCLVHWMRFNISCEGIAVSCFNELFRKELRNDVVLGDINKNSIYEIWHGEYMKKIRNAEMTGYDGSDFNTDFPCRICSYCQAYDPNGVTSEYQIDRLGTHG